MAFDSRSRYPYLSDDDLEQYKIDPSQLVMVNEVRKNDLMKKLVKFSLSEKTFNYENSSYSAASNELRLVIIGKTGQGKSATANTILGTDRFEEDFTATSVTRDSRRVTEVVDGRKISVMDTPGLQDTHQSNKSILKELARITTLYPDGVHAFIYVMNMADPRFTAEDKNVLDLIEKTFGGGFMNYCLLVFSHGDSALKDVDLDTYKKKQMAIGQATSGHPTQQYSRKDQRGHDQEQKSLANLLHELSWKMLAIDNKTSIPFEKAHNRKQIVAMVDHMRTLNNPEIYTNDMFFKAQQQREAMRQTGLRKGWDPSIMSKVETILAANPNISREQLQVEVSQQLQEEKEKIFQKEFRERQERREREWLNQQELDIQKRIQREEVELQRRVAEEQEKHAQEMQLQRDEWEKRQREEEEAFKIRQKHQQEMWERQFREDQKRRQEQEDDNLKRREKAESRRIMQQEREETEIQERFRCEQTELDNIFSKFKREESERQMKRKEEDQERKKRQDEERKQFELRQTQEREERLQEREELERRRQKKLEREELERQERRQREDMERERRWKREQEERETAEREKRQRENEKNRERLQRETEEQVKEIADEHNFLWEKTVNTVVTIATTVFGWLI